MKLSAFPATVKTGPQTAILLALEAWLVELFGRPAGIPDDRLCGIHATGEPPTIKGQWYFAIHPVNAGGTSKQADHVDNIFTVAITLSVKTTMVPMDRVGDAVMVGDRQALDVVNHLIGDRGIHGNYGIITAATGFLGGAAETRQGFVGPLYFQGQEWTARGPEWWRLSGSESRHFGYSIETRFQGANYVRGTEQ